MTPLLLRGFLAALGLLALTTFYGLLRPVPALAALPALRTDNGGSTTRRPRPSPGDLRTLVERNPFRASRRPAPVAYDPLLAAGGGPMSEAPPPPPRPPLSVSGIVWGRHPAAVLDGVPGTEPGTLVQPGDTIAGLRVVRITAATVTVRGYDTTWVLTLRQPW